MRNDVFAHDDSQWPLRVTTISQRPEVAEVTALLEDTRALVRRGEQFAWLLELQYPQVVPERHRVRYVNWMAGHRAAMDRLCAGICIVQQGMLARITLRSLFLVGRVRYPHVVLTRTVAGRIWCAARLRERGLEVPQPTEPDVLDADILRWPEAMPAHDAPPTPRIARPDTTPRAPASDRRRAASAESYARWQRSR